MRAVVITKRFQFT